jgi:hypothetical protein
LRYALAGSSWPWLPWAVMAAFGAAIAFVGNLFERRRTKALQDVAFRLGFSFEAKDWSRNAQAPQLETRLFARKGGGEIRNIMAGHRDGLAVTFFDHSYRQGKTSTRQTVAAFTQDFWFPQFEIAPQNVVYRLGNMILHRDIRFESHPELSKRFRIRSVDEQKIRELITPALLSFLEGIDSSAKWDIEGSGKTLVIYRVGKRTKPEEFPEFVEQTTGMAKTFMSLAGLKTSSARI